MSEINENVMKKEIQNQQGSEQTLGQPVDEAPSEAYDDEGVEEFTMDEEEMEDAKKGGFNPFWDTKNMPCDKPVKFRIISNKIGTKMIPDNYAEPTGTPTKRMIISVEELETCATYDIACHADKNKEGKYSSMTLAMRRLYALTNGDVGGKIISLTKRMYNHEKYGESTSYTINLVEMGE